MSKTDRQLADELRWSVLKWHQMVADALSQPLADGATFGGVLLDLTLLADTLAMTVNLIIEDAVAEGTISNGEANRIAKVRRDYPEFYRNGMQEDKG